ncbi:hypothetical protein JCM8547_006026 [Rhodosporidiobolus lusitaniae]
MDSDSGADNNPMSTLPIPITLAPVPPRPMPLPVDSHLCSADNYDMWCIQMRGLVGHEGDSVMEGKLTRPTDEGGDVARWDRLNKFPISFIIISCHASVVHHLVNGEHSVSACWTAFRANFRPTNVQGVRHIRQGVRAEVGALKTANVDLEVIYVSHLLASLLGSLSALQMTLAVTN